MGIELKTPKAQIRADINTGYDQFLSAVIRNLVYLGEQAVNIAREKGSYTDRTGNLRSSIGYVISHGGKIVEMSSFPPVQGQGENYQRVSFKTKSGKQVDYWAKGQSGNGQQGSAEGRQLAEELALKVKQGRIALIVVAGKEYASYVADTGKDVLDSAELFADNTAPRLLKRLGLK